MISLMLDCMLERIFDMNSSAALNMDEIKELDNKIYLVRRRLLDYLNANVLASSDLYKKYRRLLMNSSGLLIGIVWGALNIRSISWIMVEKIHGLSIWRAWRG